MPQDAPPGTPRASSTTTSHQRRPSSHGKQPARAPHALSPCEDQNLTTTTTTSDGGYGLRQAHGLSWDSTTRDSVVDNLLLSLGSFPGSAGIISDVPDLDFDREQYRPPSFKFDMKPIQRVRGHTYSSSLSSEYDPSAVSPRSTVSVGKRSRRSNSGSQFQLSSITGRVKITSPKSNDSGRASIETQKPAIKKANEKENDDPRSENHGYVTLSPTRKSRPLRNSMSLDHLYSEAHGASSILDRGRPTFDTATEPSTPAGPRKLQKANTAGDQGFPKSLRKTTTQSDLRSATKTNMPATQISRNPAREFMRSNNVQPSHSPELPWDRQNSPLSPTHPSPRHKDTPPQVKERQGFFKRVFGGSSRAASATADFQPLTIDDLHKTHDVQRPRTQMEAPKTADASMRSEIRQASRDPASTGTQAPPSLNKKPSSFFRRRKKSISADLPPPVPRKDNRFDVPLQQENPSASSLRKAMDSYLNSEAVKSLGNSSLGMDFSGKSETQDSAAESDDLDMFHPGYTTAPGTPIISKLISPRVALASNKGYDQGEQSSPAPIVKNRATGSLSPSSDQFSDARKASIFSNATTESEQTRDNMRDFSGASNTTMKKDDEHWFAARSTRGITSEESHRKGSEQYFPKSLAEAEVRRGSAGTAPIRSESQSGPTEPTVTQVVSTPSTEYHSATSLALPSVLLEGNNLLRKSIEVNGDSPLLPKDGSNDEYVERARKIFEGDEENVTKQEAASWLGEQSEVSSRTLLAYMQLFDLQGMNLLAALRALCGKLLLRGETQQFDRIITALSERWCECNPKHGFKAQDVVHTIFYSLILLNTDLHMADIGEKMSRNAYVKNTLPTIRRVVTDAAPNAFDDRSTVPSRPGIPWMDANTSTPTSPTLPPAGTPTEELAGLDVPKQPPSKRLSLRPGMMRPDFDGLSLDSASQSSNALVNTPWNGPVRGWEMEIEIVLKSFWTSIRAEPLPLLSIVDKQEVVRNESFSNGLKRSGSIVSKAPSESMSYRSKPSSGFRTLTSGWPNKTNRSRQKLYPYSGSSIAASSHTSFDDNNTLWSPSTSNIWSKNSLLSKTLTSASMSSLGLSQRGDYKHSIGFANALSQAIIREEVSNGIDDNESIAIPGGLLEDEALALEGAPWAKEGLLKHKYHRTTEDKKAKERSWTDCFAVISKGKLTLFAFGTSSAKPQSSSGKMGRVRSSNGRAASIATTTVGGGDWMENAECLDSFVLRQTTATTLPPPGYSKNRPHVWALSLPSGAVHLFQVGTPDIAKEFISTANYWSARLSKEPLVGGVSNIEYGWSDNVLSPAARSTVQEGCVSPPTSAGNSHGSPHKVQSPPRTSGTGGARSRPSFQSSLRGSIDTGFGGTKIRLHGDKVQIAEWQPPTQSMMASQLLEVDQIKGLSAYVRNVEEELAKHNELKPAIELTYSPRNANYSRVLANWQRKSEYLLREIIKFQMYVDTLEAAQKAKLEYDKRKAKMDAVRERTTSMEANRFADRGDVTPRAASGAKESPGL
ncbi:Hypothetical protein R9X50_00723200 [Acrodontium crateriforme]|uniref:SEC7 domain-containing protein n=1 Tax=Acrodontium crateriforme TaxID=150365 RepID=A0AAQ3MC60_9PEZI|nr:Hypothetical protein R9X50_00723200 [Acrodontium crateriforme]